MYVYTHTHKHTHTHPNIHTYKHTHTHTHTHTQCDLMLFVSWLGYMRLLLSCLILKFNVPKFGGREGNKKTGSPKYKLG
jgi:hypothetical protein